MENKEKIDITESKEFKIWKSKEIFEIGKQITDKFLNALEDSLFYPIETNHFTLLLDEDEA